MLATSWNRQYKRIRIPKSIMKITDLSKPERKINKTTGILIVLILMKRKTSLTAFYILYFAKFTYSPYILWQKKIVDNSWLLLVLEVLWLIWWNLGKCHEQLSGSVQLFVFTILDMCFKEYLVGERLFIISFLI